MQIQWKVILLVLVVLVGTTSAVVWKTQALVLEDKIGFLTDSNIKQIAPLRKLVETKLGEEKETLVDFASARAGDQKLKASAFGDFDVVSLVQSNESQSWAPTWIEHNPSAMPTESNDPASAAGDTTLAANLGANVSKKESPPVSAVAEGRWPQGYDLTLLKSLNYSRVKNGEVVWTRLSDHQGLPIYAMMMAVEVQDAAIKPGAAPASRGKGESQLPETTDYSSGNLAPTGSGTKAVVVGFASGNPLATVTEEFIGSMNSVYLVDDRGYVASHNNRGYLGALFSEDPVAKEIIKTQKNEGTGRFEDLESQRVLSHYERVDGTNLYAVISTPMSAATSFVEALVRMALTTAALVGLVGLLLAWFVGQSFSESIERLSIAVQNVIRGGAPSSFQVIYSKDEFGKLSAQLADAFRSVEQHTSGQVSADGAVAATPPPVIARGHDQKPAPATVDRRAAYEAFSEGLNEVIKQPLMSILGHVQLSRAKTDSPEVRAHIESIEREARRVKDTMDRLRDFEAAPAAIEDSQVMHLDHVVASALESVAPKLEADDIELERHTEPVPEIRGDSMQMQAALAHVLENAREAVKTQPVKKLVVSLFNRGDQIVIEVKDTGVGMSRDVHQKVFEPFYKNFDSPAHLGLGLAFVQSAMKRIEAKIDIDSSPGEGALIRLSFPVTATERASFEAARAIAARGTIADDFAIADAGGVEVPIGMPVRNTPPRGAVSSPERGSVSARSQPESVDDETSGSFTGDFGQSQSGIRQGTLGGRTAVGITETTNFPPPPKNKAEDMVSDGASEAGTPTDPNVESSSADSNLGTSRGSTGNSTSGGAASDGPPPRRSAAAPNVDGLESVSSVQGLSPRVPKQPPAGASAGRVPQTVREQRLANAMESIAAASSLFDDEDEAFANVSLGQGPLKDGSQPLRRGILAADGSRNSDGFQSENSQAKNEVVSLGQQGKRWVPA